MQAQSTFQAVHMVPDTFSDQIQQLARLAATTPRKANLAIFPGRAGGMFIDNGKYAFLHLARNLPELSCHYLTTDRNTARALREQGFSALVMGDEGVLELLMRAGLVVCDDFWWKTDPLSWAALHPARTMQLWHGIPLKAIGMPEADSGVNMTPEKREHLVFSYSGYDSVLSTSPFMTETTFGRAFRAEHFPELGYPRNDALLRTHDRADMINVDTALYGELVRARKQGTKVVFYMPTFRDTGKDPFGDRAISIERMDAFGREQDMLFVLKLHPYLSEASPAMPPNVRLAAAKSDPYPLLSLCDLLFTDYSSIYFDFLLLDRPMVFYPYDFDEYVTRNRELLFDYDEMTPGPRVADEASLYTTIRSILKGGKDVHQRQRRELAKQCYTHPDGQAASRLAGYIRDHFLAGSKGAGS